MCDLIDLNSPDTKGLLGARLASPLIPVPSDITCDTQNNRIQDSCSLAGSATKRDSLENNPFDMVLHKTTEYIQKKGDPFEVALERALKLKHKKNIPSQACSVNFNDDFTPKRKRHIFITKLNRTLDESLLAKDLDEDNVFGKTKADDSMMVDLNDTKLFDDDVKENIPIVLNEKVPTIDTQISDLSILNQSVLSDTLLEANSVSENKKNGSILKERLVDVKRRDNQMKDKMPLLMTLQVPKLRRCISQGEKSSPNNPRYLNRTSQSLIDDAKIRSLSCGSNGSSIPFSSTTDFLNEGFMKSQYSDGSVFSSLSNISAISRSTAYSTGSISSMATSNGTINRTFIESCSSDGTDYTKSNERPDTIKRTSPASFPATERISDETNKINILMSDLVDKLSKLKQKTLEPPHVSQASCDKQIEVSPQCAMVGNERPIITLTTEEAHDTADKLIDIDVFKPDNNCSKENSTSFLSDDISSPDSVFSEGNRVNRSILQEAKALARTFEELALKSSSGSTSDDLMSSNPLWISELLPAFEEEAIVENLIELPASPNTNLKSNDQDGSSTTVHQSEPGQSTDNKSTEKDLVKCLEAELIEPEQKVTAATLLFDLKKLVKSETNVKVNVLLENLEKALGIECKNNTELLATYLCPTNNLAKSPQKANGIIDTVRNVEHENMENSQEENTNVVSKSCESKVTNGDINLNVSDLNKQIDGNQKCISNVSKAINVPDVSSENVRAVKSEETRTENNETDLMDQAIESPQCKTPEHNNDSFNEKVAVDILGNLSKLLNGKSEEQSVLALLKTLGKVISSGSNSNNVTDNQMENGYTPIQQTPKKSKLSSESKAHSPKVISPLNRRSLNTETKKKSSIANLLRRSISVTHSPPGKTASDTPLSKSKNASRLKEVTKRFPSDPGLIDSISCKKSTVITQDAVKTSVWKTKSVTTSDTHKEKPTTTVPAVKNKLKKTTVPEIINKKGPLKATLPIANMQRKESLAKKISSTSETITPPKSHKIISSTPNSVDDYAVKKSPRSKPVASSTPDAQTCKVRKIQMQPSNTTKKRNFSCDISPVINTKNVRNSCGIKSSPRKENTAPSPRKTTPKRRPTESSIPKSLTPPVIRRAHSSLEVIPHERLLESPKRGKQKKDPRKNSPIPPKHTSHRIQQSPLKDVNKLSPKVKPFNLISKLRSHSNTGNIIEKENNYI